MGVHSMKEMPSTFQQGLKFASRPKREDSRDVLILKAGYYGINNIYITKLKFQ